MFAKNCIRILTAAAMVATSIPQTSFADVEVGEEILEGPPEYEAPLPADGRQTMQDIANRSTENLQRYGRWITKVEKKSNEVWRNYCFVVLPAACVLAGSYACAFATAACGYMVLTRGKVDKHKVYVQDALIESHNMCVSVSGGDPSVCPDPQNGMPETPTAPPPSDNPEQRPPDDVIQARVEELQKNKGIVFDPTTGTVTGPGGISIGTTSGGPIADGLRSAGLTQGLSDFQNISNLVEQGPPADLLKDLVKKPTTGSGADGLSGGGGASATNSGGADGIGNGGFAPFSRGKKGNGINRDPAQVRGLATSFNGEPVGVALDNIFGMIQTRYDIQEANGKVDAALTRAPNRR